MSGVARAVATAAAVVTVVAVAALGGPSSSRAEAPVLAAAEDGAVVALAPILIIVHDLPEPGGHSATAVDLAAISVFFTTVVGAVLGFRSADPAALDVVSVYGGGKPQQFLRVRLVSALPALFTTLQIAAPAAYLGALLGEYFDRHLEVGVGPSLILAQNNRETALAWSLGIACAVVAGVAYLAIGLLGRIVTPWSKGVAR